MAPKKGSQGQGAMRTEPCLRVAQSGGCLGFDSDALATPGEGCDHVAGGDWHLSPEATHRAQVQVVKTSVSALLEAGVD